MKSPTMRLILSALVFAALAAPAMAGLIEPSVSPQCSEQHAIPGNVGRSPWRDDPIEAGGCILSLDLPA